MATERKEVENCSWNTGCRAGAQILKFFLMSECSNLPLLSGHYFFIPTCYFQHVKNGQYMHKSGHWTCSMQFGEMLFAERRHCTGTTVNSLMKCTKLINRLIEKGKSRWANASIRTKANNGALGKNKRREPEGQESPRKRCATVCLVILIKRQQIKKRLICLSPSHSLSE